ncbi:MAG TPA: tetratricopeptide repeat protein [Steroidobacteraceae bacterium]|nr:tetratricopeptide repeat protein [Steroidobacteraceae bacterium]
MNDSNQILATARALDQQGRLAEAIDGYRQFLASDPRNGDVLQLLGIALGRAGRPTEAAETLSGAAAIQPGNPVLQANLGNALNAVGRPAEALACYGRAVALKPDFAAAHHGRGMTLLRLGHAQAAVQALSNALRLAPGIASLHNDLAVALERLDRRTEALSHFERATQLDPNHAQAHLNRGLLEAALGRLSPALESVDRALALQPLHPATHANRGNILADLGRKEEAIASYDQALALQPRDPLTLCKRGRLLVSLQRLPEALNDFEAAVALAPGDLDAHFQRGVVLVHLERPADALQSFDRVLATDSATSAETLNNRGVVLVQLGRFEQAHADFARAIALQPRHREAYVNAANNLTTLQRHSEALPYFDRALSLEPQDPHLQWGKARLLLSLGDFRQGWPLHESRLQLESLRPLQRHTHLPRWQRGESIAGRILLVHAEQGLGDTVQFSRYLPLLEAGGAQVIFEVQPALALLLRSLPSRARLVPFDDPLPAFDIRTPLLSLPWLLGTELESIPGGVPYLSAEPARIDAWRRRLAELPGFKVGLAWQGSVATERQGGFIGRSFGLAAAGPLAGLPAVTLVSLQKGAPASQRGQVDFGSSVLELTDPWEMGPAELLDTAALMSALDLVVTADSLTAHLAGALGIPVWVVLSSSPDWRWLTRREDSPWYPTMRLFRQQPTGGWPEVFARVARELEALSTRKQR